MTASAARPEDATRSPWRDALSRDEMNELLALSDLRSWVSIAVNWGLIAASFALVAVWPNPLTVIVALCLIGARQLGCAVLMHEAAHRTLFRTRALNDGIGSWLCAYPVWSDLHAYRNYHLKHHAKTGSAEDPDLGLITPFPITPTSLRRKVLRDLTGRTGLKFARGSWRRSTGSPEARRVLWGMLISNGVLLALLALAGHPELYLLWIGAWFTTNTLVTRIRAIAEHAMTPDRDDPLGNTRTTLARWWERLLIAPNRVNYHLEHHLLMTVPHYALPRMHRLLKQRGVLDQACIAHGYPGVLRTAASRTDAPQPSAGEAPAPRVPPF